MTDMPAPLADDTPYQARVHRTQHHLRRRIVAACLADADRDDDPRWIDEVHPSRRVATRISDCCRTAAVWQSEDTGALRVEQARCNHRFCPRCSVMRAWELECCVREAVKEVDSPMFLTLTMQSREDPLKDQIARLVACARRMRQRKQWQKHIKGGVQVIETTYNANTGLWHPHLHILADATYWKQKALSREWLAVTEDSRIVDVRRVHSQAQAAKYIAKYTAKGADVEKVPPDRIPEWIHAMRGVRLAQTFGTLHGVKTRRQKERSTQKWCLRVWLCELEQQRDRDDGTAALLMHRVENLPPTAEQGTPDAILETHRKLGTALERWLDAKRNPRPPAPPPRPRSRQPLLPY